MLFTALAAAKFGFDSLQAQQEANRLNEEIKLIQEELIKSNKEVAEAHRQLAESNNSSRRFRIIGDLFHFARTLFGLGQFFTNRDRDGRPSGRRDPNDTEFNTPSSVSAHRARRDD